MKYNKNRSNSSASSNERKTPRVIGLGLLKLDFYINLTEDLIKTYDIDFQKINSPKDLKFFCEFPILLNSVQISTTDNLTNILLYLNKANSHKSFVELITLNSLRFKPEEEFMRKIFAHVTETNYLFTNEMNLANVPNKISFAIKNGKKMLKYFDIVCDYDPFAEETRKEENQKFTKNFNGEIDENDEKFLDEKGETGNIKREEMTFNEDLELKDNIVEKEKENEKNIGKKLNDSKNKNKNNEKDDDEDNEENEENDEENNTEKEKSNLDFKVEDVQPMQEKIQNDDLLSKKSQENKKNITNISDNILRDTFEKNQIKPDKTYDFDLSRTNQSLFKLFNIPAACEIEEYDFLFLDLHDFLNFHSSGLHLIELAEFLKKIILSNKTPKIVVNFPNILFNINIINLEIVEIILSIMSFTDIFLYDKKECLAFFNMLSQMNNEKEVTEKTLFEHFTSEIPHLKSGVPKLALFLEDMQKFNILENKHQKIINKNEYPMKLFPKINHTNQKVIDDYKKIMILNNNYFRSIFFGGFFSKFIFLDDNYSSFLCGLESVKRILELFKNRIDFPINPDFYIIKIQKNRTRNIEAENLKKKEEQFILDCGNKKNSAIRHYNPLFDDNLNAFFASRVIRKQLKNNGFINTNGFVLYDPSYKNVEAPKHIKKRLDTAEREKHLMHAIKNNKDIFNCDLESYSRQLLNSSPLSRRLPKPREFTREPANLYLKKGAKKTLRPLYFSYLKKEKDEKTFESTTNNNTRHIQKETTLSKSKKYGNNYSSNQNYNNINKSHLNNILNESSDFKEEKTDQSKSNNHSKYETSSKVDNEKTHTNQENNLTGNIVSDLNDKLIVDTLSTKNKENPNQLETKEKEKEGILSIKEKSDNNTETSKKEKQSENVNVENNDSNNMDITEGDREKVPNNNEENNEEGNNEDNEIEKNNEKSDDNENKEEIESENKDKELPIHEKNSEKNEENNDASNEGNNEEENENPEKNEIPAEES